MKLPEDLRKMLSLKKEYDFFVRRASQAGPDIEREYFQNMANNTSYRINWDLINSKPKKEGSKSDLYDWEEEE